MGKCIPVQNNIILILCVLGTIGVLLTASAHLAVYLKLRPRRRRESDLMFAPAISILKPLKGVDDNLDGNLLSFVRQDYPRFELLLGVEDEHDPAVDVARQIQRDFPRAPIRLVIRQRRVGLNPKVNNLLNLLEASRYEHLLVSDSNVMVARDYLRSTVPELANPKVGLVSNVIVGAGEETLGAWLENVHLNTFILAGVCLGDSLGHPVVVGKSMLMRRADLMRLGGFESVRDVLAEDYVLGTRFQEAGMRVVLSPHPVCTVNQTWDVGRTLARHGRWAKLRRWLQPAAFLLEPATAAGLWFSLALLASVIDSDGLGVRIAIAGLVTKTTLDALLFGFVRGEQAALLTWPIALTRDCLWIVLWLQACVSRSVHWRGNRLRVGRGSRLTPVHQGAHGRIAEVVIGQSLR